MQEYTYDIVVVGGGMSGVSAAIRAAERGHSTLLVEQSHLLGGMGTGGLITMMMTSRNWFYGLGKELIEQMIAEGTARYIEKPAVAGYNYYPYDGEAMKRTLDARLLASGATLLLGTRLCDATCADGRIQTLLLHGPEGFFSVRAKAFIDATGEAVLAESAGEATVYGDGNGNIQAPTMLAYYAGVDFDRYEAFLSTFEDGKRPAKINMIHTLVPRAVADGVLRETDLHHPGVFRLSENADIGLMNAGHVYGADTRTSRALTDATVRGRCMAWEYLNFYRRYVPGFENAYMTNTGSTLALREGRHAIGRYVMPFSEKANYVKHADAVMRMDGGAVSDVHASSASREAYESYRKLFADRDKVRTDDYATLPLRSLQALCNDNLLYAGRCISAEREVLGQIRIMGYCFMMGEAAGLAASLALERGEACNAVDVTALQAALDANGIKTV